MSRGFEVIAAGEQPTEEMPTVEIPDAAPPPAGSLLADLRRRTAQQRSERTLDLDVGGAFGDRLVLRYGVLPIDELERYSELQGKVSDIGLALDVLVRTCRGVYGRTDDGELELLRDEDGSSVGLDTRLAELLAVELPPGVDELTPREIVSALFGNNALMLGQHVERLVAWMQGSDTSGEVSGAGI
jgi:hypothetical protein